MVARTRRLTVVALTVAALWGWVLVVAVAAFRWEEPLTRYPYPEPFPHGTARIGVDASYPPFAVATADGLFGLEIDLGNAIAEYAGIPAQFTNMGFDGIYDVLRADQVDIVISSLQIEPHRLNDVRYTRHYFNAGLVLVTTNPDITAMADLPGYALAYEFGSEADGVARQWLRRVLPFDTRPYELPEHALDAVRLGEAEAALVDSISARVYLCNHPQWTAESYSVTDRWYVIATRRDRRRTWQVVNEALQALDDSGELDAMQQRWLCDGA